MELKEYPTLFTPPPIRIPSRQKLIHNRMPRISIPRLIDLLTSHSMRLYDLFVMSKNFELSEGIYAERQKIIQIISTLETLLEDTAIHDSDEE